MQWIPKQHQPRLGKGLSHSFLPMNRNCALELSLSQGYQGSLSEQLIGRPPFGEEIPAFSPVYPIDRDGASCEGN